MRLGPFKAAYDLKKRNSTLEHLIAFVDKSARAAEIDAKDRAVFGLTFGKLDPETDSRVVTSKEQEV